MFCLILPMYSLSVKLLCGMPAHNVFLSLPSPSCSSFFYSYCCLAYPSLYPCILVVELTIFHADCSLRFLTCDSFKWPPFVYHATARLLIPYTPPFFSFSPSLSLYVSSFFLGNFAQNIMLLIWLRL